MRGTLRVIPIEKANEKLFLNFLNRDMILHVFTIYDLKHMRDKTQVWMALKDAEICGYMLEFDKRIVHTHGTVESVTKLLHCIDLDELIFVIEPHHLTVVKRFFKPVEPTDPSSKSQVTTYLVMKANADTFKPLIRHQVKKLEIEDLNGISKHFGEEWKIRVDNAVRRGIAFGAYEKDALASIATVPEIIANIAFIRGVYTVPSLRGKGLATSAISALVKELINLGKEVVLWVAKDNLPARRIYEKMGFQKTKHVLLGVKARKL